MLKTAYNRNKASFICFAVAIGLILLGFIVSFFPIVENIYSSYYAYYNVYNLSEYDVIILMACVSSVIGLALNNEKYNNLQKIISYALIIAYVGQFFFFQLFCELFEPFNLYFDKNTLMIVIGDFLILLSCILLLVSHIKKLPSICNIVAVGCIIVAFLLQFVSNIVLIMEQGNPAADDIFFLIVSFIVPLFFVGDLFITLSTRKNSYNSEIKKELYALKVKREIGSITEQEYNEKFNEIKNKK